MNDIIDRYVWAVAKDLPDDARDDVARELRATIEDMVEARGPTNDETVREVLVELGDPAELAQRYSGTKRYLIGPAVYPLYARLLRALLLIIVPIVLAATLVERLRAAEDGVVAGVLAALNAGFATGVMLAFWVTLVFAVLERAGVGQNERPAEAGKAWDPDSLPPAFEKRQITLAGTIFSLGALSLLAVFILWLRSHSVVQLFTGGQWLDAEGGSIPFLDGSLWRFWMPAFLAVILAGMAIEVWKCVSGYWTLPLVAANVVVNALFAGIVIAIAVTQTVVASEFLTAFSDRTGTEFPLGVVGTTFLVVVLGICVWDSIECVVRYRRIRNQVSRRGPAAESI